MLLRRWRLAAGLSQEALAERAGLRVRAVAQLENGEWTSPRAETLRRLAEALNLSHEEREALARSAHSIEPRTKTASTVTRFRVPLPPTPLVGREREVASIRELLNGTLPRLVTLTGAGGVGKTRLALEVAAVAAPGFRDGVCFVPLASVTDPNLVVSAIARAVGLQETPGGSLQEDLEQFLGDRHILLVLDNFEHVLPAAQRIADLLRTCVGLKVLTTSRAPLRLLGERQFPVPPLGVPGRKPAQSLADVAQTEAVQLFMARAQDVRPEFILNEANVDVVAEIVQHLDGVPLAIVLAAARVTVLSPNALLARLSGQLSVLTGGHRDAAERHQTMRAAIAWSYDLLSPEAQWVFRRVATFVGGATLEAIAAATGQDPVSVLDDVENLVDQSLLMRSEQGDGQSRFRMLEPIREFALERLVASGEEEAARDAHAAWCLMLGERTFAVLRESGRVAWFDRLESEVGNLRAASAWLAAQDRVEDAVDLAMGLFFFYHTRGYHTEASALFEGFLAHPRLARPTRARAKTLLGSAILLVGSGHRPEALAQLHESIELFREAGDPVYTGLALVNLGNAYSAVSEFDRAIAANREVIAIGRETNDTWLLKAGLHNLAVALTGRGRADEALPLLEEVLAMARAVGDIYGTELALVNLAHIYTDREEYARAEPLLQEAIALLGELGHKLDLAHAKIQLARVARGRGDNAAAAAHLEEALETARGTDDMENIAAAHVALGDLAWLRGDHEGAMSLLREGVALSHRIGDRVALVDGLVSVAGVAMATGDMRQAARLLGGADALLEAIGTARPAGARAREYDEHVRAVRDALGADAYNAAWSEGRHLAPADTVAEALAFTPAPSATPAVPDRDTFGLSPRELEVMRLLAEGLTDQQIADALFVSRRTITSHTTSILTKLQVPSRTAAVAYAIRHGLV